MRLLILMRHAKSSWSDEVSDHARPLNARGERSALALGGWLRDKGHVPDGALVSSAMRTRKTFEGLQLDCPVTYLDELYHADASTLMNVLRRAEGACVLVIAHSPGIADFAERIVTQAPDHPSFAAYPTGATLIADFPTDDWKEAAFESAAPVDFIVPRELTE